MELRPGALIAGRYRVDRKIGAGGMGEVWAGEHLNIGVRVALKTLLPAAALDRQIVARFRREAQLLARLRSDRIARVVDFVEDRQFGLVLVMDFVEGELLGKVLAERQLGLDEVVSLGVDIVTALRDLHAAKVVHRDLKPDNIILEPLAGGGGRAVIVDLGVSRLEVSPSSEEMTSITQVDTAVGTLPYMAPEQLLSSSTATASADVYAVGAILYRAISGEQVFGDDDGLAARRKITGEAPPLSLRRVDRLATGLTAVVARALRRHPEDRFQSAAEMLLELTALRDLAHAMTLDLDAATEEALPPSALALHGLSPLAASVGREDRAPPPIARGEPSPSEEAPGEETRRMSRPPVETGDFAEEATQLSLASRDLLRAEVVASFTRSTAEAAPASELATPSRIPATSRPTVPSPVHVAPPPPAPPIAPLPAPPIYNGGDPRTPASAMPEPHLVPPASARQLSFPSIAAPDTEVDAPRPRTVSLRLAALGLVAALAVGTVLGFQAHRLVSPPPASVPGAER